MFTRTMPRTRIGVLCLQGAFREHISQLEKISCVQAVEIRTAEELQSIHGLIIPGGESTTMAHIAQRSGMLESLVKFRKEGWPVWGTCAGMILLAERVEGQKEGGQELVGGLDVLVCRNFFGAQVQSFEIEMEAPQCITKFGSFPFRGVFIRAPAILQTSPEVQILCDLKLTVEQLKQQQETLYHDRVIVAVKSNNCLATAFHPELTGDHRWHQLFVEMVTEFLTSSNEDVRESKENKCNVPQQQQQETIVSKRPSDLPIF